ncbi:MAG: 1-(5-phosphoribosyl)-5-[(5-phosphoribosylamino)methylideneamino]imidazole-4-carboxamide isomerase [Clostridiales bacterium]|jgi:phosphoribosylformimino-5-aminoimidazole carboxamide ribotide isomerase|nr:1-(5-phosphoribosyl)-5-[(5-phosphoribosylamino)methylideneamino]imidazole-4-carboxamide isomerase [Clostridiales bacterium]
MRLFPAIDILGGKCVRLKQGAFDQVTVYNESPAQQAKIWQSQGASYIHVVDLDGARYGTAINDEAIRQIINAVGIPVQVGGGIRAMDDAEHKLSLGARRVIIGTSAARDPDMARHAVNRFGADHVAVGVDARDGFVSLAGWTESSQLSAWQLCKMIKDCGVKTIVYTDIAKDGMLSGPSIEETAHIIALGDLDVIASGGVSGLDDLYACQKIGAYGAIIGKALYTGAIDLSSAVNLFEAER